MEAVHTLAEEEISRLAISLCRALIFNFTAAPLRPISFTEEVSLTHCPKSPYTEID